MSRGGRAVALLVVTLVAVGAVAAYALWPGDDRAGRGGVQASLAVSAALGSGDLSGFARATAPRPFSFPADSGPHPEFRTEWWYYTGNLETAAGRHFGFQLTFFRTALAPPAARATDRSAPSPSAWSARQLYLAHFALTDTAGRRFHAWSRLDREALGLAGAQASPFRVWLEDWSAESDAPGGLPVRLRAAEGDVAIDLVLASEKPVALQGDRGLSRKGPEPGNASYYYSLSRMTARGTVRAGGEALAVSGLAWMDREWSTSALGPELVGWDWVALQLDDGRDVMLYRLRRRDGPLDQPAEPRALPEPLAPRHPRRRARPPDHPAAGGPGADRGHSLLGGRGRRRGRRARPPDRGPRLRGAGRLRGEMSREVAGCFVRVDRGG